MAHWANNAAELVGHTPLVELNRIATWCSLPPYSRSWRCLAPEGA